MALAEANHLDLAAAPGYGLGEAQIDRLRLTPARIAAMAKAMEEIAAAPEPIGEVISSSIRPNGLEVQKVRVPLGVIFFIYESRPNVTTDAAAICVKSGNAVILRGGKEAAHSNAAIAKVLAEAAAETGMPADAVQLVATPDRAAVGHLLQHARVHRPGHSPRRREPDPPRERRGADAGHQALRRQLPRLPRSLRRRGHGRERGDQREVPADGRVQRRGIAAGARRRGRGAVAPPGPGLRRAASRSAATTARDASCPRRSRPPRRTIAPSTSAR